MHDTSLGGRAAHLNHRLMLEAMLSAADGRTLGGVVSLVLGTSIIAALIPAIRAARLEPMQALRNE